MTKEPSLNSELEKPASRGNAVQLALNGIFDAMSARLMDQGVCVFRNCARGTKALVRYVEARLYADALRTRN